jgi:hypothetical protein
MAEKPATRDTSLGRHLESDNEGDHFDQDDIDESVREDMQKLEETFTGISERYRLINRIGEGRCHSTCDKTPLTRNRQEHFPLFTKRRIFCMIITKMTGMLTTTWTRISGKHLHPRSAALVTIQAFQYRVKARESLGMSRLKRSM